MLAKKPRGGTAKRKTSSASGLLWMFVGAVLTLMIGVFLYLSPWFNFSPADTAADPNKQIQQRVDTDADNGDYEFYDILPNQEMATVPDEELDKTDSDQLGEIIDFEPDVIVNQTDSTVPGANDGTGNISEGTISAPNAGTSNSNTNIINIE